MHDLQSRLARLDDADRAALYREALERLDDNAPQPVRELVLVYERRGELDETTLRARIESRLPAHERPTRLVSSASMPTTRNGKLDRRGLPGLIRPSGGERRLAMPDAAGAASVAAVAEAFASVLGRADIDADVNFFDAGGHSLLAVECILAIESRSGRRLTITEFLNQPTPRGLARLLDGENRTQGEYLYPVSDDLSGLPVFVFSASRLAYALRQQRPDLAIHGVQLRWRDEQHRDIEYHSLEDMAGRIAAEIGRTVGDQPFVLAGSSFPAMLAFEVARQLRRSGRTPALTVLIEPSLWSGLRSWVEHDLAQVDALHENDNVYWRWLVLNSPFRHRFWLRLARRLRPSPAHQSRGGQSMKKREQAYETARTTALWKRYRPAPYDGPAVLISGAGNAWRYDRGWRRRLGNAAVHSVAADHRRIAREPFLSDVIVPLIGADIDAHAESRATSAQPR